MDNEQKYAQAELKKFLGEEQHSMTWSEWVTFAKRILKAEMKRESAINNRQNSNTTKEWLGSLGDANRKCHRVNGNL